MPSDQYDDYDDYKRKKRSSEDDDLFIDETNYIKNGYVEGWGVLTNLKKRPGRTTGKVRKAKMAIAKENCPNSVQDDKQFCANLAPPAGRRNRRRNKGEPFNFHN